MDIKSVELGKHVTLPYIEQGDRSGVPVVLLHGFAGTWRSFREVLRHLPASIRAFAVTQRGHGDASKPPEDYRVDNFAADLAALIDVLQLEASVVVGASSGGFTARRFAVDHPDRTLGLVLLGTPATLRGKPRAEQMWESTISKLNDPVDPTFVRQFAEATLAASVPESVVEEMVEQALKLPAHVWRRANRGLLEDDSLHQLEEIAARTLIVWGDQDLLSPRSEQERIAAMIPDARLLVYPGAGHTFYYEEPERVAADLATFVLDIAR